MTETVIDSPVPTQIIHRSKVSWASKLLLSRARSIKFYRMQVQEGNFYCFNEDDDDNQQTGEKAGIRTAAATTKRMLCDNDGVWWWRWKRMLSVCLSVRRRQGKLTRHIGTTQFMHRKSRITVCTDNVPINCDPMGSRSQRNYFAVSCHANHPTVPTTDQPAHLSSRDVRRRLHR